jgi:hypothetical protein
MIENKDRALKVAELLLKVKAVKLQPQQPFTWASGWKSPIYCDNRVTLSHPAVRTFFRQCFSVCVCLTIIQIACSFASPIAIPQIQPQRPVILQHSPYLSENLNHFGNVFLGCFFEADL